MTLAVYINIVLIGVLAGAVVFFLQWRKDLLKKNNELQNINKLMTLEARALQSQMNPHFIYNSLSTVQYLVMINENEKAFNYLSDFSLFLRQMIEFGSESYISIKDEMEFLKRYIELEKVRFSNKFDYIFNNGIATDVLSYNVPSMMIQPIVENAIKHGLAPRKETAGAMLEVTLAVKENMLICKVEDNGIGMKKEAGFFSSSNSADTALQILTGRLKLLNSIHRTNGSIEVKDKPGKAINETGVIVDLYLPIIKVPK